MARRLVAQHGADKGVRGLSTERMPLTLPLAQVSEVGRLRDIEALLESQGSRRYHSGLGAVCRSTLADAAPKGVVVLTFGRFGLTPSHQRARAE